MTVVFKTISQVACYVQLNIPGMTMSTLSIYACCFDVYYLIVFVTRFEMQNSIYLRIISSLVFILRDLEIQMTWNVASYVVAF